MASQISKTFFVMQTQCYISCGRRVPSLPAPLGSATGRNEPPGLRRAECGQGLPSTGAFISRITDIPRPGDSGGRTLPAGSCLACLQLCNALLCNALQRKF